LLGDAYYWNGFIFGWSGSWLCLGGDMMKKCDNCPSAPMELWTCPYNKCEFEEGGAFHFSFEKVDRIRLGNEPYMPLFQGFRMNRKGWICPRCDTVVSPDEKTCPNCKPKPKQEGNDGNPTHITE
jgi:hypothetical protein